MLVSFGTVMARKTISFVYLVESPLHNISSSVDIRCMAIVGDYIAIATDSRAGVRNTTWIPVQEHLSQAGHLQSGSCTCWSSFGILDASRIRLASNHGVHDRRGHWVVERFCRAAEMVVHQRIIVFHHGAYNYFESFGGPIESAYALCYSWFTEKRSREDASTSLDEGDMPSRVNPFDD
ncbi:hypothetical protein GOP47_0014746 [Adiantum capillus-veneris]|uniref:Uncharacterized protein n=1 Tax=Adiantum capillus-veneris TaxID=13818 RepID=A0A9D4ZCG1_ADICA|nr:hypothetical protein GOP47_0014746 [Adiantum capillus-veneris]